VKLDGEYVNATSDLTYTLDGLPSGTHTVSVVLTGNDHTETTFSDSVTLEVFNPSVEIVTPTDGTVLDASSATMGITISDFTMSEDIGGVSAIGQGHYHVLVDGAYFDYSTDATRALATRLDAGSHSLSIELVNADHSSLATPVMDTITVTVADDAPGILIDQAALAGDLNSATLTIPVAVRNFTLSADDVGAANVSGQGHYHVYLDGVYQTYGSGDSVTLYHVAAGPHIVELRLAENDHTEIVGGAVDYARVSVAESRPDVFITSPAAGDVVTSTFTLLVSPENFTFDEENAGGANVDGSGHYHIFADGNYYTYSASPSVLMAGFESGEHTLSVMLVNNDHTDLDYPVWSEDVTIVVTVEE